MKPTWTERWGWRLLIGLAIAALCIYLAAMTSDAWAGPACDPAEVGQLRFLVQMYGRQRTDAEFALAKAEAGRQALEERVRGLEQVLNVLNQQLLDAAAARAGKPGG